MWPNPPDASHLVTFTGKILNGKVHFLCSALIIINIFTNIIFSKVDLFLKSSPNFKREYP